MRTPLAGVTVALALIVSACGSGPAASPTEVPASPTSQPASTPVPTPTRVLAPTATALPRPTPVTIRTGQEPEPAADFRIDLLSGEELALSDLRGKVVVLNFWATWCPPCREEMPSFESIYREYQDREVVFVGVAVADTEERARDFVEGVGVTYPIGLDPGGIAESYRVTAMPTTFFIDREGTITRKLQGQASEGALRLFLDIRVP